MKTLRQHNLEAKKILKSIFKCDNDRFKPLDTYKGKPLLFGMGMCTRIKLGRCKRCRKIHIFNLWVEKKIKIYASDNRYLGILAMPEDGGFPPYNE